MCSSTCFSRTPLNPSRVLNPQYFKKWESRFRKITVAIDVILVLGALLGALGMGGVISTGWGIAGFSLFGVAFVSEPLLRCCKRKARNKHRALIQARTSLTQPKRPLNCPPLQVVDEEEDSFKDEDDLVKPFVTDSPKRYKNYEEDEQGWFVFLQTLGHTFHPKQGFFKTPPKHLSAPFYSNNPSRSGPPDGVKTHLSIVWGGHATFGLRYKPTDESTTRTILLEPSLVNEIPLVPLPDLLGGNISTYDRIAPPGFTADELGPVDVCVISHNHEDHAAHTTLKELRRNYEAMHVMAPEGTGKRVRKKCHLPHAKDHTWWQSTTLQTETGHNITFTAVPAHHSSCKGLTSIQKDLWCGWVIEFEKGEEDEPYRIWMMGDTACHYNSQVGDLPHHHQAFHRKLFDQIHDRFAHFDLVLWPIDPLYGEEEVHMNLDQGIHLFTQVFKDVDKIIPMHYGAWAWGPEPNSKQIDGPVRVLERAIKKNDALYQKCVLKDDSSFALNIGDEVMLF